MRFYRRVKCLTAVSLLFFALDNCSAVIKMIPPSFTSYCTKPVLLVPKQNISHRCYRGFKENSGLNWTCDCGYSTLLLEMKVMFFFPSHLLLSAAATYSPEACVDTGQVPPTQCRFLLGDELIWQNAE